MNRTEQNNVSSKKKYYQVKQLGNFSFSKKRENPNRNRVYSVSGICPALNCATGGGLSPHIIIGSKYV